MKRISTLILGVSAVISAAASIPSGYYDSLSGKKGSDLKVSAKAIASGHTVIKYGDDTWNAFELTDAVLVGGRLAWRDMYSNEIVWVETGHGSLNIEHSVPKSWWGGDINEAYQDLFHLNPSNPSANNRKSNWPLGRIQNVSWTNGITTLGSPDNTTGGGAKTVFEPADQYKGDFARAYFYIFTTYDALPWEEETDWMYLTDDWSYPTLKDWAIKLLLEWAANDPVDSYELTRNEAIYGLQGNRNPFIDIPDLAEYIWGSKKDQTFSAKDLRDPEPINRPSAPTFGEYSVTEFNTYAGRWWNTFTLVLETERGATTEYRIDGGDWIGYASGIQIDAARESGETLTVEARSRWTVSGLTLVSPVSKLVLTAKDPEVADYKDATWRAITDDSEIDTESYYILVSNKTFNIMSTSGDASSSNKYVLTAGTVTVKDGWVIDVPENAALISFSYADETDSADGNSVRPMIVGISNLSGKYIGALYTNAARQMVISTRDFSPATVSTTEESSIIDFGEKGRLQFNTSSPRFVPYTSNQESVRLYINDPAGPPENAIDEINDNCSAPERIFDLQGRELTGRNLPAGLYIRVQGSHATKILIER